MPGLFFKRVIPAGSTLVAKVTPKPTAPDLWSADLFLRRSDGTLDGRYDDAQLRAGVTHPLSGSAPAHYLGQLVITFAGASEAHVRLEVVKPDGKTPHGKPYDETHSDAPADAVALALFMA